MSSSNRSQPHHVHFENLCIRVFCSCVLPIKAEPGCYWHGAKQEFTAVDKGEVSSWELVTLGSVDTIRRKEERKGDVEVS